MKKFLAVALSVVICISLCGCQSEKSVIVSIDESIVEGTPTYGGSISLYSFQQDTFNPLFTQIQANYDILNLIFEPIVKSSPQGTAEGVLITKWTASDDGKVYTLQVREGVKFHDGEALTAKDVAASIRAAAGEGSPFYSSLNAVSNTKVNDDKVVVSLINPVADFIKLLEIPVVKSSEATKTENFNPIGTGPYVYDGSKKNKAYTLSVNENWWKGKAYISTVNVTILPDKAAVTYSYDAANIDGFSTDVITAGKYAGDGRSRVAYYAEDNLVLLGFNNLSVPFAEAKMRRGVAAVIDKEKLNDEAALSSYTVTETPVNPNKSFYSNDVYIYSADSNEATPDEKLPFELMVCSSSAVNSRIGEGIAEKLKTVGFNVTLVSLTEEEYYERINQRQYDAFIGTFALKANNDLTQLLGEGNYFNYSNDTMVGLLNALPLATNDKAMSTVYADIQRLYSEELPFVSLFFENKALVIRNSVGGELVPKQGLVYNGAELWYTETD